jgi:DNA gyrase inhibitor GyrI
MVVDFEFKRVPSIRVVSVRWKGPWKESKVRSHFEELARWAAKKRLRTGKWIFAEPGERQFEASLEVRGKVRGEGKIRTKTLPATRVAAVTFDPDSVSARVIYHGITDWLRWRKKEGEVKRTGAYREVYDGNPWTNARAWARTTVQVVVKK